MGYPLNDQLFSIVNKGAHRKPAAKIGAPGLVQHYAFRLPANVQKSDWHRSIDYSLFRLFFVLWNGDREPYTSSPYNDFKMASFHCPNLDISGSKIYLCRHNARVTCYNGQIQDSDDGQERELAATPQDLRSVRYELFSIDTVFMGLFLSVRAEIRNEYWNVTFLADLSRATPTGFERQDQVEITKSFAKLSEALLGAVGRNKSADYVDRFSEEQEAEHYEIGKNLYERYSEFLDKNIIDKCERGFPAREAINWQGLGERFADFRGVIIGATVEEGKDDFKINALAPQITRLEQRRTLNSSTRRLPYSGDMALRVTDAVWPAIRQFFSDSEPRQNLKSGAFKPELTVTRFQSGRSIYISSLGRVMQGERSLNPTPVRYLVIVSYENRWQLGRLIERINSMGALRLAAIFDIEQLQNASDKVRDLYVRWQQRHLMTDQKETTGSSERPRQKDSQEEIKDSKSFAATEIAEALDEVGRDITYGMSYRIERSAYYVRSFDRLMVDMRAEIVEGFQPYEDFVRFRMGGTFDFINRVGLRYRELRSEVELILEQQRSADMRSTAKCIFACRKYR